MTKADIVSKVQDKTGLSQKECSILVDSLLDILKKTLDSGDNIKISGFGSFTVRQKADRKGRNPQTGETITIGSRRVVSFKCSPNLKLAMNSDK